MGSFRVWLSIICSTTAVIGSNKKKTLNLPLIYKIYFKLLNEIFSSNFCCLQLLFKIFSENRGTRIQRSLKICMFLLFQNVVASFPCAAHLEAYLICTLSSSVKQSLLSYLILYEHISSMLTFFSASLWNCSVAYTCIII